MKIFEKTYEIVKKQFENDAGGHDLAHIERVVEMARVIQRHEGGNLEIIELAALLHDISDHKLNGGKLNAGAAVARDLLLNLGYDPAKTEEVALIIDKVSYKGADVPDQMESLEGKIVQDADRLDAIGAIGIGRTFAYGGHKGHSMHIDELQPVRHESFESYAFAKSTTVNHFYEKLLLLKDRLHTTTAKEIGEERHAFMEQFLERFLQEWNFRVD